MITKGSQGGVPEHQATQRCKDQAQLCEKNHEIARKATNTAQKTESRVLLKRLFCGRMHELWKKSQKPALRSSAQKQKPSHSKESQLVSEWDLRKKIISPQMGLFFSQKRDFLSHLTPVFSSFYSGFLWRKFFRPSAGHFPHGFFAKTRPMAQKRDFLYQKNDFFPQLFEEKILPARVAMRLERALGRVG